MKIHSAIFQDLESFGKRETKSFGFSNWRWKTLGFLLWKILKYPKMDITQFRIKHSICCVCSFKYL